MDGLSFVTATSPVRSDPARADIACFVGFVARRAGELRAALERLGWGGPDLPAGERSIPEDVTIAGDSDRAFVPWLRGVGWNPEPKRRAVPERELFRALLRALLPPAIVEWWSESDYLHSASSVPAVDLLELRDVPVPIDTWDVFDALFAWDERPLIAGAGRCDTALGAAVRSFFAQGGRKCYVVRLGDPWPALTPAAQRGVPRSVYLPERPPVSAVDRRSWRGVRHLFALPDVSFLCLPDLPDFFSATPLGREKVAPPETPEIFVECSSREEPPRERALRGIPAPFCDARWLRQLGPIRERRGRLSFARPRVRCSSSPPFRCPWMNPRGAATPSAHNGSKRRRSTRPSCNSPIRGCARALRHGCPAASSRPTACSPACSRTARSPAGSWRSAIRQPVPGLATVEPVLDRAMLARDLMPRGGLPFTLRDRVTVIGPAPGGFRLLSDVTTDVDEAYRPANINRLMSAIVRAARGTGESAVFDNNGEALWARLRDNLADLLAGLWAEGALDGASSAEACDVRCDRSTMTQADLDAGPCDLPRLVHRRLADRPHHRRLRDGRRRARRTRVARGARRTAIPSRMSDTLYPLTLFRFQVDFERMSLGSPAGEGKVPICRGAFSECTGLEATMEPKVIKAGGWNYGAQQRAGPVTFGTVILKRGMTTTRDLWKWFSHVNEQGTLRLPARRRHPRRQPRGRAARHGARRSGCISALPVKFKCGDLSARATEVGIEELHLAHEGLSLD